MRRSGRCHPLTGTPMPSLRLRALSATLLVALAGVSLSACTVGTTSRLESTDAATPGTAPGTAPAQRNPGSDAVATVTQERVKAAVAALPAYIKTVMDASGVPGLSVAVVYQGKTVLVEGYGVRSLETGQAVDADTVFQLASLSKSVGATVVAREVDRGTVTWDTPLVKNLPGFALADPWVSQHVTIADMYTHRSGLPDHAGDDLEDLGYTRAQILRRLRQLPLATFRITPFYTNFGLTAAAESVARAAGLEWAALSERDLYQPLGMTSTSSRVADYLARDNRAVPHVPVEGKWGVTTQQRRPDAQSAAGGVSSSASDMAAWMNFVLADGSVDGKPVVSAKALIPAITGQFVSSSPASADARPGVRGYGFNVGTTPGGLTSLSHSGAFALGTGTAFTMLPGPDLGIIVLTNGMAVGAAESVAAQFIDLAQFGAPRQDWWPLFQSIFVPIMGPVGELVGTPTPTNPAPAKELASYAGVYRNSYYGRARVKVVGDHLELVIGPGDVAWPLRHWDGDVFTYAPYNESAPLGSVGQVTFRGSGLVVELLDGHGMGTFTR